MLTAKERSYNKGLIFILSGPSGSGKTTILTRLLEDKQLKTKLVRSISLTTRPRRRGEKDKEDYFFVTEDEFKKLKRAKKILEWTKYLGYYYATPREFLETQLDRGKNILMCLDVKGAFAVKRMYPRRTVTIFILPPDITTLYTRISQRSQKTKESQIAKRMALAKKELGYSSRYDYCLVNDKLEVVLQKLKRFILRKLGSRKAKERTEGGD